MLREMTQKAQKRAKTENPMGGVAGCVIAQDSP
jgi:hypothetical protein